MTKSLKEMAAEVLAINIEKGWDPDPDRTFGDEIALLHSEVSEALEAYREHGFRDATREACHDPQCGDSTWDHDCPVADPARPDNHEASRPSVVRECIDKAMRKGSK